MNDFRILSVQNQDLEKCLGTIQSAFKVKALEYGFTKENYPTSGAFMTYEQLFNLKKSGCHMYACWTGEKIVGFVLLQKKEQGIYSLQKFSVLPEYQQFGIGKSFIQFCKNKVLSFGGKKIILTMVNQNTSLKNFYLSNGFEIIKLVENGDFPFIQAKMELNL